jgi:hypothetical protein
VPLTYHNATVRLGDRSVGLTFAQQQQNWLDSLHFDDSSTFKELPHGKGRMFWAAHPVELSEDLQATAALYTYVTGRLSLAPSFKLQSALSSGVLVFPIELADSVMYVFVSDAATNSEISLRDQTTGVTLAFHLPAEHAAVAVIGKKEKKVVAKYGF